MSRIALLTDTTANMPRELAAELGIRQLPVYVIFGNESLKDYEEISPEEFYRRLVEYKQETGNMPTTSQPSPADFVAAYEALADEGYDEVISVHVTAKASGTCQSAQMAAEEVKDRIRVHVVDSATTSMQMGFMLMAAAEVLKRGGTAEEALAAIEDVKSRSALFFTVTELEHLAASGRTQGTEKASQSALKVKPVVGLLDGVPKVVNTARTYRSALQEVIRQVKEAAQGAPIVNLAVVHGGIYEKAKAWAGEAAEALGYTGEVIVTDFGPALAVHFGPGLLGLAAEWE